MPAPSRSSRLLRLVAAGALACAPLALGGPASASDTGASDVFRGTVVDRLPDRGRPARPAYRVEVLESLKGRTVDRRRVVVVGTPRFGRRCEAGDLLPSSVPVLLFTVDRVAGTLVADRCGDVAVASDRLMARVRGELRTDREPVDEPSAGPAAPALKYRSVPADDPRRFTRAAAPGVGLVVAGLLGLALVRRLAGR